MQDRSGWESLIHQRSTDRAEKRSSKIPGQFVNKIAQFLHILIDLVVNFAFLYKYQIIDAYCTVKYNFLFFFKYVWKN